MRCFIGVRVPITSELEGVLIQLEGWGRAIRAELRANLHLTLSFLGDVDDDQFGPVAESMTQAAGNHTACHATLNGLGAFPSASRPSVIWVGVDDCPALIALQNELVQRFEAIGFPRERRPFTPHLTLARVKFKPPPELRGLLDRSVATCFGSIAISQIELMESRSEGGRTRYLTLAAVSLRGP